MMKPKLITISVLTLLLFFITSAYAKISTPFPIANNNEEYEFAVTFASDGEKFLVPVIHQKPDFWGLYAQFVNLNGTLGNKITIEPLYFTKGFFDAKVAYGNGKYLVIWTEVSWGSGPISIKGVFIDPDGNRGDIFTIASGFPAWDSDIVPNVSFGGGKFLVAYEKPLTIDNETHSAIYGRLVVSETNISNEFQISQRWGAFNLNQISFGSGKFLVVYRDSKDNQRILGRFVSPSTGRPTGSEIVIDNNNLYSDNPLSVLFDGSKFFVVWPDRDLYTSNIWRLKGRFVYPDGNVSEYIINISEVNAWTVAPFIAFDGTNYLVTWTDGRNCGFISLGEGDELIECIRSGLDVYGRFISKEGDLLGNEFIISSQLKDEVGGFYGRPVKGRILGLINRGFSFTEGAPTAEDVDGMFFITSGYSIFAPSNREKVNAGSLYTIRWRAPGQAVKFDIAYSNDNKNSWYTIAQNVTTKSYDWNVPAQDGKKPNSFIRIVAYDSENNRIATFDSKPFSIEVAKIIRPEGGEVLIPRGTYYQILWNTFGLSTQVDKAILQYTVDGINWTRIATVSGGTNYYNWFFPQDLEEIIPTFKVRVIFRDNQNKIIAITESDAVFTITPPLQLD